MHSSSVMVCGPSRYGYRSYAQHSWDMISKVYQILEEADRVKIPEISAMLGVLVS